MSVIGAVFARGGSKGVPHKNLRELAGKPLVVHAVEQALAARDIDRVIVSTDSPEIARVAEAAGAEVPWLRPAELSDDSAREWDAWRHLLRWLDRNGELPDWLLVVPCTAPLRRVSDLDECVRVAQSCRPDVVLTVSSAQRNPWFNMVQLDEELTATLILEPPERIHRRQDAPPAYDVGTVAFVVNPEYVMGAESLYDGRAVGVELPPERCLDIDTELDLQLAELVMDRSIDHS